MQNKKIKYLVLIMLLFSLTACGTNDYIKDENNNVVVNSSTGQNLQKYIYCKPSEGTETYELYQKYEDQMTVKLSELPTCEEYTITYNSTSSLWQFLLVKPLVFLILKIGYLFRSMGATNSYLAIALILVGLLIRLIILPFNIKTQKQSRALSKISPELQKIEKKYANRTDQESMMMKSQETMNLYKKYQVNPMLSCVLSLIQLPIFFAFLQAIYNIPAIYEGSIFGLNLGTTPSVGISTYHNYYYLIFVVLIALTTYFSFRYTMKQTPNTNSSMPGAAGQMKIMLYMMTAMITFMSFTLPLAMALYWITTYAFIIAQTYIMNLLDKKKRDKEIAEKKGKVKIKDKMKVKEGLKYGKDK